MNSKSILTIAIIGLGTLMASSNSASAQQKKGGQVLRELSAVKTADDIKALKTGDTFAMVCTKCQTIWVAEVKNDAKGAEILKAKGKPMKIIGKHQCQGCGSEVAVTGHGKGKTVKLRHTCDACGDESAFCCATKPDSGPTKGMEKK